ncbi:hypothetical protein C5167_042815 [Papaver somniferum]|uniref:Uncharacterized protein n=1 Tax=Papaver somniferum TaxID=3469 RepID=A0A4Y7L7I0_PAPSO|nr:hypothetical protein C5167_042815 [Papaver somniferum]
MKDGKIGVVVSSITTSHFFYEQKRVLSIFCLFVVSLDGTNEESTVSVAGDLKPRRTNNTEAVKKTKGSNDSGDKKTTIAAAVVWLWIEPVAIGDGDRKDLSLGFLFPSGINKLDGPVYKELRLAVAVSKEESAQSMMRKGNA